VPEKPLGGAGGSVRRLGAAVGATSSEADTSHPRSGTARRPAYREWRVRQGFRALSEPWTADTEEVMIWAAKEDEYRAAGREGRSAVGVPRSAEHLHLISSRPRGACLTGERTVGGG
jgi:hypothetical protein